MGREFWVLIHTSPILYRYIDWTITVPLQMIEFYLILSAVSNKITQGSFWKLLIGTVVMLVFGYTGEAHLYPGLVRHHAPHCHCRLVYLPSWLLLWLPHGWC